MNTRTGRVYRLTQDNQRIQKKPPKLPSQEAQNPSIFFSLSLSRWPYPALLLPNKYRYSQIVNKSTHGIVYHVKPASP